ncbi:rab-GTPase-TBC domain-containing protein [Radiomyces spectabilis]|uniref:rab-GTPase-TBC domain-containing protein n=1 Tax=Radiomyces spectabilis TaxID=64574 RepID=UPI00221FEBF4|nr:rab-GTPase-TBC domain-containing protein [Radiomyces spectabilis]KAI8393921.1 rab-GTPase-TBC domain-containing protein [Radiomyces spectabilis]
MKLGLLRQQLITQIRMGNCGAKPIPTATLFLKFGYQLVHCQKALSLDGRTSFWRRRGAKLPGSVSIVPRSSVSSTENESGSKPPILVGARYNYTSLVTSHRPGDKNAPIAMLPCQYPSNSSSALSLPGIQAFKSYSSKKSPSPKRPSPLTQHQRSLSSTHKSFDAFLMDTNDEWNDTLEYATVREPPQITNSEPNQPLSTSSDAASPTETPTVSKVSPKPAKPANPRGMKDHLDSILNDPTNILLYTNPEDTLDSARTNKFKEVLSNTNVDLVALRALSWSGIPKEFRLMAWQLLLGYLPCNSARRVATLARKRKEYSDSVAASYARGIAGLDQALWHQIHIDIPRTNPGVPLYQYEATQLCLERILYQWAIRHPASGYVQGINDLVTPIFEVFLAAYIDEDPEDYDVSQLDPSILSVIEADSFWCLSKLLDGIQDNYTFAQPGIQRQIVTLKELVCRIDARLTNHLQNEGIEFIQFAFRWMNCLLMRELPLKSIIRMWDTYLAEGSSEGFSEFHVYVCAAFLVKWSEQLQKLDFQGVMIFLQQLPTQGWSEKDVELLLSEAYMWKTLFHNAPSHLK